MPLPATTAEGPITLAEGYLAATFAACARFQTLMSAANAAAALARIYIDSLPQPAAVNGNVPDEYTRAQLETLRPFLLISQPPRKNYRRSRVATDCYAESGILTAYLEVSVATGDREDLSTAFRKFKNHVGVILTQMDAFAYLPGYLAIDNCEVDGPFRCEDDEVNRSGDWMGIMLTLYWNGGLAQ